MRFLIVLLASLLLLPPEPSEAQDRTSPGSGLVQVGLGAVLAYPIDGQSRESGGGVELNLFYPFVPSVGVYGGFYRMDVDRAAVDASDPEMTGSLENSGYALGTQLTGPKTAYIPGLVPWVRGGMFYNTAVATVRFSMGDVLFTSDAAIGQELAVGVSWRLSRRFILSPAVRYRTHPAMFHGSGSPSENRVSYATAGIEGVYALSDFTTGENGRQEPHDPFIFAVYGGAGSYRGWNYAGASAEWFPAQQSHVSVFGTAGVGTILLGGGVAYYTDRHGHGLIASVTGGIAGAHANLGGQLKLGDLGYLIGGVGYGSYFLSHTGFLPFLGFEYRFE